MNSGLSQWIVSVKAGTHLSNVTKLKQAIKSHASMWRYGLLPHVM